jgi:hypothetical protein
MRVFQDSKSSSSRVETSSILPILNLSEHPPILGSIAISLGDLSPYYANGTQWLPFGGGGPVVIESGRLGTTDFQIPNIITNGTFQRVLLNGDFSPPSPHPSFTIDTANSLITINEDGTYLIYYKVSPTNTQTARANSQPEAFVAQLQTTTPSELSSCTRYGGFVLDEGSLFSPDAAQPQGASYADLNGTWSGFLPSGTSLELVLSITANSTSSEEALFGEGGKLHYMGIVKL